MSITYGHLAALTGYKVHIFSYAPEEHTMVIYLQREDEPLFAKITYPQWPSRKAFLVLGYSTPNKEDPNFFDTRFEDHRS